MKMSQPVKEKDVEQESSILSLATAVGLIGFFIVDGLPGGLTSVQGFFIGFFATLFLYFVLAVLDSRQSRLPNLHRIPVSTPADISITQTESENGITIQIFMGRNSPQSRETDNER